MKLLFVNEYMKLKLQEKLIPRGKQAKFAAKVKAEAPLMKKLLDKLSLNKPVCLISSSFA